MVSSRILRGAVLATALLQGCRDDSPQKAEPAPSKPPAESTEAPPARKPLSEKEEAEKKVRRVFGKPTRDRIFKAGGDAAVKEWADKIDKKRKELSKQYSGTKLSMHLIEQMRELLRENPPEQRKR
jgi:hypothetical protein